MVLGMSILIGGIIFFVYHSILTKYWKTKLKEKSLKIKDAEAQLIQMEKMASLGVLAAGIAHEINNPLSFLISNLEFLRDFSKNFSNVSELKKEDIDQLRQVIQEAEEGTLRIKKIVQDLRTFSRKSESQRIKINVNQILDSTLTIIWNEIKYKAAITKDYRVKSQVEGDSTQLTQVVLNILINASQAITADKGTIKLFTYEDQDKVYIKIMDTGSGIAPEVLPKIFDPFFSTKKGTGLGLSVSYNIIKQHGGSISAESEPGKGATFIIALPRIK
jgi:two-component system NtrC family sensor kinase